MHARHENSSRMRVGWGACTLARRSAGENCFFYLLGKIFEFSEDVKKLGAALGWQELDFPSSPSPHGGLEELRENRSEEEPRGGEDEKGVFTSQREPRGEDRRVEKNLRADLREERPAARRDVEKKRVLLRLALQEKFPRYGLVRRVFPGLGSLGEALAFALLESMLLKGVKGRLKLSGSHGGQRLVHEAPEKIFKERRTSQDDRETIGISFVFKLFFLHPRKQDTQGHGGVRGLEI